MKGMTKIFLSLALVTGAFTVPAEKEQGCSCARVDEFAAADATVTNQTHPALADVQIVPAVVVAKTDTDEDA